MPKGVYVRSEEHKRKSAIALRKSYNEYYKNRPGPMFGKKHSIEAKKKIALASSNRVVSKSTRIKIGNVHRGKKHTDETKHLISEKLKKMGHRPPNRKGTPLTTETKLKMSKSRKGKKFSDEWRKNMSDARKGNKSHFWRGGITEENKKLRNSLEYRFWREAVFERDKYTCVLCNTPGGWCKKQKKKIELNADHIKRWALYPELRFDINNGRTLCLDCHQKTDTFGRLSGEAYNKKSLEDFRDKTTAVNFKSSTTEEVAGDVKKLLNW